MSLEHVPGKKTVDIKVYALSTCPWCKKTKALLDSLGVDYYFVDVDLLSGVEREQTLVKVKKWNPGASFPTIVIDDTKAIVGFKEQEIKEAASV
jgi:glutaredoxin